MIELPAVGEIFAGKYIVRELLGRGGNAAVFRASDEAVSRDVALKIIIPDDNGYPPQVVKRFMREGRVLAGLVDPHNITMFDFGKTDDGLLYMVFEYVDGRELGVFLADHGPLEPRVVAHIMDQLLQGLEEAHQAGILHRDVKPANILVFEYAGDPYRVKLLDFGIARPASADGGPSAVTADGVVIGTPRYMAPEQMLAGELTASSDLFSLGLVAYEMLTGRPAFDGSTARELTRQQFAADVLTLPPGCAPPEFSRLIERMINRDVDERPSSALEVRQQMLRMKKALGRWAQIERAVTAPRGAVPPVRKEPDSQPTRQRRYGRRFLVLATVALVIGAALAVILLQQLERRDEVPVTPTRVRAPLGAGQNAPRAKTVVPEAPVDAGPTDAGPAGCRADFEPGTHFLEVDTATGVRTWAVHLPTAYDGRTPLPVVLMFHRTVANGEQMLADTKMTEVADENGFIVLAPNSPDQFAWQEEFRETEFVRLMVAQTAARFCLDLHQVYLLGEGRGGEFAEELECNVPVSAIAITLSGQTKKEGRCSVKERRTPRIRIYGKLDRYVPPEGGKGCLLFGDDFLSASEIETRWKNWMGCGGKTTNWLKERGGTCRTWKCDVPFVHCETAGGHDWPGAPIGSIDFPGCEEARQKVAPIDYGSAIWTFFSAEGYRLDDNAARNWREGN